MLELNHDLSKGSAVANHDIAVQADGAPDADFDYEAAFDAVDPEVLSLLGAAAAPYLITCHADIVSSLAQRDGKAVSGLAHSLKCMAAYFGALPVQLSALQIERLSKAGQMDAALDALVTLDAEMRRFAPILKQRMLAIKPAH